MPDSSPKQIAEPRQPTNGNTRNNRPKFIIIGAGITGCTLAYELSKWAEVHLFEKDRVGEQGASSIPLALLNPFRGRSARAHVDDLAGHEAMLNLVVELETLGLDHGIDQDGILRIASNNKQTKKWKKHLETYSGIRWLETEDLSKNYNAPFGALLFEEGCKVHPKKLLTAVVDAAIQNGATLHENSKVNDIQNGSVICNNESFKADAIFLCAGWEAPKLLQKLSAEQTAELPEFQITDGEVISLNYEPNLPHAIAGAIYGGQRDSQVHIGGNHRQHGESDLTAPDKLQESVGWFVPELKEAERVDVWTGSRLKTEDSHPVVRQLDSQLYFVGAMAGRGFLVGVRVARALSTNLLNTLRI